MSALASVPEELDLVYFFSGMVAWCACFSLVRRASKEAWALYGVSLRDQWEWLLRVVSILHAAFVSWNALPWLYTLWFEHEGGDAAVRGSLPGAGFIISISVSYFVWDLVMFSYADYEVAIKWKAAAEQAHLDDPNTSINELLQRMPRPREIGGVVYIAHHMIASLGVCACVVYECHPIALAVGVAFEITTPFLNATWLCEKTRNEQHPLYRIVGYAFVLLWTVFRLATGGWCLLHFASTLYTSYAVLPWYVTALFCLSVPGFNCLNWFWFLKIVARAIRKSKSIGKAD